jgi:hypothetical protein
MAQTRGIVVAEMVVVSSRMSGEESLRHLAAKFASYGPPIIVFNKSHSGSRILARLLGNCGVFIGNNLNESEDSPDILRLIEPMVERHYPDYTRLMGEGDPDLVDLVVSVFENHLRDCADGQRWGWKLCETLYILPILSRLFPGARYVHLVRDGRDVSFSDHVSPELPFWRKVYFDTADITCWRGHGMNHRDYRRAPHVFNARHWVNSVSVARHYGAMLGEGFTQIRYEDLVQNPEATARRLLLDLNIPFTEEILTNFAASTHTSKIGKYRREPSWKQEQALEILHPTLASFGYNDPRAGALRSRWSRMWRD